MATVPGYASWQTCAVISTWASTRKRRQSGKQHTEGDVDGAKAKAKAKAKPTLGSIGAVAPCTIPVPSNRIGMVRLMILSREAKDANIVFSAGRFAQMLTVPTQSIFCQIIPSSSEWTKGGNFSATALDKLADILHKCFHAPTPTLHSDCVCYVFTYISFLFCLCTRTATMYFLYMFCTCFETLVDICLTQCNPNVFRAATVPFL